MSWEEIQHKDTKAQRHKEKQQPKLLLFVSLRLRVFVLNWPTILIVDPNV